nr:hypothetical protein CFP56_67213 [Quercus suber]POF26539.1 hypothetical protein CFP56_37820 [Quercus suber]
MKRNMKKKSGIYEDVSIPICGTVVQNDSTDIVIINEEDEAAEVFESRYLKESKGNTEISPFSKSELVTLRA